MKRKFLKFAPVSSHRWASHPATACYKSGGKEGEEDEEGNEEDEEEEEEDEEEEDESLSVKEKRFMKKIETRVAGVIKKNKIPNGKEVTAMVTRALKGLNIEALGKYGTDKEALELSIRNMSAEVEKIKGIAESGTPGKAKRTAYLKNLLDKNMDAIRKVMEAKGESNKQIVLTTRAAQTMTMDAAITEPVDMPDDIIESFSLDAFAKIRRPNEYIFQIANRRTVSDITEYKTWLEEGDEEGAFAIVAEGEVKPLMSKSLIRNWTKYKKVAGKRVYTEEFAKFRKEAYRIIEDLFNDQIMRDYNAILTTSLLTKAAAYVGSALDGLYETPTDFHAVGAVASQIETLNFVPDLLILNPQDKWRIGLQQNSQGSFYMPIPMYNPSGEVSMMGFRIFTSNRIPVGTAILGESQLYKIEDEPVQIRIGYGITVTKNGGGVVTDVKSDVDSNQFRIIAETFFHDWIATNHTGSFVSFNFADVKEALQAA